ncbi:MAG: hypothetical protein E2O40_01700 [Planctomycetota bacterium]|nr:MAG: hypothetical protein E2O40_01700 [Planctomycetota bacterium]
MSAPRVWTSPGRILCPWVLLLGPMLLIAAGCATSSGGASSGGGKSVVNPGQQSNTGWPFWPQKMRVHPLSQFVKDRHTGNFLLEARVEFSDPYGHICKAYGEVVIALYDANPSHFEENEIGSWAEDLTDLDQNQIFFDDVTGTYLFRLEIEGMSVPDASELQILFHSADGSVLQDSYVVQK